MRRVLLLLMIGVGVWMSSAPSNARAQNLSLDGTAARHGTQIVDASTLAAGFEIPVAAGVAGAGPEINVQTMNLGEGCLGYSASTPGLRVVVQGRVDFMRIFVDAGTGDAALVLRSPSGRWFCNDDGIPESTNPMVDLNGVDSGGWLVWVASYESARSISARLTITSRRDQLPPRNAVASAANHAVASAASSGNFSSPSTANAAVSGPPSECGENATRTTRSRETLPLARGMGSSSLGRLYSDDLEPLQGAVEHLPVRADDVQSAPTNNFVGTTLSFDEAVEFRAAARAFNFEAEVGRNREVRIRTVSVIQEDHLEQLNTGRLRFTESSLPPQARYFVSKLIYGRRFDAAYCGTEVEITASLSGGIGPFSGDVSRSRTTGQAASTLQARGFRPRGVETPNAIPMEQVQAFYREDGPLQVVAVELTPVPDCAVQRSVLDQFRIAVRSVRFPPRRTNGPWDQGMFEGESPEIWVTAGFRNREGIETSHGERISRPGLVAGWAGESYLLGTFALSGGERLIIHLRDHDGGGRGDNAALYEISSREQGQLISTDSTGEVRRFEQSGTVIELFFARAGR